MDSKRNIKTNSNGGRRHGDSLGDSSSYKSHEHLVVLKSDLFLISFVIMFCFYAIISIVGACYIAKLHEKMMLIEDVVFVHGFYKQVEKDK